MHDEEPRRMARREAIKWVAATVAMFPALDWDLTAQAPGKLAAGTLSDPDLFSSVVPWQRTLTQAELRTMAALCDMIIPEDDQSPAASAVGVPDFIDEWVSAPYPIQQADKALVQDGLVWLDAEGKKRFQKDFAELGGEQKTKICDDICYVPKARAEFKTAAEFFTRVRDLAATGFYTTKEGMKDLRYVGNTPQFAFNGPPKAVLEHLKLA